MKLDETIKAKPMKLQSCIGCFMVYHKFVMCHSVLTVSFIVIHCVPLSNFKTYQNIFKSDLISMFSSQGT